MIINGKEVHDGDVMYTGNQRWIVTVENSVFVVLREDERSGVFTFKQEHILPFLRFPEDGDEGFNPLRIVRNIMISIPVCGKCAMEITLACGITETILENSNGKILNINRKV